MRRHHARAVFAAAVGAQMAYGTVPGVRTPRQTQAVVGLLLAATGADALVTRGRRRGVAPMLAAGIIGTAAEVIGVRTGVPFGRYRYGKKLGPTIGGVAAAVPGAWAVLARPAWVAAGRAVGPQRPGARVVVAAAALTAWDVFLDPRMAGDGYWIWAHPGRYEGIPLTNFCGWFVTGLPIFAVFAALDGHDDQADDRGDALALYAWTWVGETIANATFWGRPRVAAAGGLTMGAVALPALFHSWRDRG